MRCIVPILFSLLLTGQLLSAQTIAPPERNRTLRYQPDGTDFVITNGTKRFNRALYGHNTGFRIEAGDLPEFALYLPGMGGTLRFGLSDGKADNWLIDAQNITTRYRPGMMIYSIADPMLGAGTLEISAQPLANAEGLIVRLSVVNIAPNLQLLIAYGGATGKKFSREGDLGADPESSFYLKPEYCADNEFKINQNLFSLYFGSERAQTEAELYWNSTSPTPEKKEELRLQSKKQLTGLFPPESQLKIADATAQNSPEIFFNSTISATPALAGKLELKPNSENWFLLANPKDIEVSSYSQLPELSRKAEAQRQAIAGRIKVETPDPYLNTVGGALAIAADAIWEEPSYLHGAIAWRMRLNGWRGAYAADALGWHDRAKTHFTEYLKAQYLEPASGPSVPDPKTNLARQEEKIGNSLFTEGYISRNPGKISNPHHYDMNLVFFDQILRHFNWTADTLWLREAWPAIQRHLAWEKRCFDPNNDGLYDAYASIWASDALQYSGGSVTHSSAYNYYANKTAARLARILRQDPAPYEAEADKILTALNRELWMPQKGWFAENQDLLGLQKIHPAAAIWTIYHAIDSEVPDPFQARQCLTYIDAEIPHIPINANGLPDGFYTLSTTNWMPYTWSINNVASGEVFHTALAYWQSGRNDEAYRLMKSSLLDYMYLGSSPGNFGQLSQYDAFRGELYRDFADGIGIASRALIEGLFGIKPDALNGRLLIEPGFPSDWNHAFLQTPDISISFQRNERSDHYRIETALFKDKTVLLRVNAPAVQIGEITVNGQKTGWKPVADAMGQPMIELVCPAGPLHDIRIEWIGETPEKLALRGFYAQGSKLRIITREAKIVAFNDPQQILVNPKRKETAFQATLTGETGARSAFIKLQQGSMEWWEQLTFELRPPVEILAGKEQPSGDLEFTVRNYSDRPFSATVQANGFQQKLKLDPLTESGRLILPAQEVNFGSTPVQIITPKAVYSRNLVSWNRRARAAEYETIGMDHLFNDKVTQIFKNQYLSPRSPYPTLAIPTQGIGDWCSFRETEEIDDSGLRAKAGDQNRILLPQGIPFATPGNADAPNILFTSQWDNYPHEATVPLSGKASHAYLLMAGSTHHMQSRFDNGEVFVDYTDGTSERLVLRNPETWWPIEQDYYDDGLAFSTGVPQPVRLHLKTGEVRNSAYQVLNRNKSNKIEGGAATLLDLPLNPDKELKQLRLKTLANDVVIGLMGITLVRPEATNQLIKKN